MTYQIILFDLDDTLIDFSRSEAISLKIIHENFYSSVCYTEFECLYKSINSALWARVGAIENKLNSNDVRLLRFAQLNEKIPYKSDAQTIASAYEEQLHLHVDWFPEVKNTIEFLHQQGHILGIITNGLLEAQYKKHQHLELDRWFDCFIISDEVGVAKPHKEIFQIALTHIASKRNTTIEAYAKNSILMVGDSLMNDGHGAMNFGIHYCYITNSQSPSCHKAITYKLPSVTHLPACIGYESARTS